MAKLDLLINELNKDQETQNKQIFVCMQNLLSFSTAILSQIVVNYRDEVNSGDTSTTSSDYVTIPNYAQSFTVRNPLSQFLLTLQLKGQGYIGVFVNGLLEAEIPFNHTGFNQLLHQYFYTLRVGNNTVEIKWRASTGTVIKGNSATNSGFNAFQIISFNS
jgi:hypothetical protein